MSVTANSPQTDWDAIRAKLAAAKGKSYWRSLEELARTPEFMEAAAREFPRLGAPLTDFTSRNRRESSGNDIKETTRSDHGDVSRRAFLTVMGASLALAGLAGCGAPSPAEKIVPYLDAPADTQPGIPLTYATAMPMAGYGQGILVTAREGRPIKIEGNPTHPSSLGATDAITQASLLSLYDPDRSQEVLYRGFPSTWDEFLNAVTAQMETLTATGGTGLYLLTGAITSPTLTEQMHNLLQRYPNARWCQHEPVGRENASGGAEMAFGRDVQALYRFDRAEVIVSLDADFLLSMPGHVRYARDFSSKRTVRQNRLEMNRLYAVESTPTITGASADHRLALPPDAIEAVAREMATALGLTAWTAQTDTRTLPPLETRSQNWIASVVRDLRANDGKSLVVVGESQPPTLHALAHAINEALGNGGHTVVYIDPIAANPAAQSTTLAQLANDMHAGKAKMLVTLDSNPAYTAPADLEFTGAMAQVPFSVHLGEYEDETANLSLWHLPQSQYLETWSDIRAHDGTITIQQPLIAPLYATRTSHELLSVLNGRLDRSNHDILRDRWQSTYNSQVAAQHSAATMQSVSNTTASNTRSTAFRAARTADQSAIESIDDFTLYWRTLLNDGIVPNTAATPLSIQPAPNAQRPTPNASIPTHTPDTHEYPRTPNASTLNAQRLPLSLVFTPDPTLWDGRYNNNGWLQELPKPVTKLTWENAACISPRTAQSLDLADGELVSLRYRGRQIEAPVLVVPGHAEETVSISLGYGRTRAGSVGTSAGFNA